MVQSEDAPATTMTANASSLKQEHSVVVPLPTVVEAASPSLDDHNVSDQKVVTHVEQQEQMIVSPANDDDIKDMGEAVPAEKNTSSMAQNAPKEADAGGLEHESNLSSSSS